MSKNSKSDDPKQYDAIVIGTGITGGWAAKELCENGLKTLVLERGRMVEHVKDYPTMFKDPWDFDYRGFASKKDRKKKIFELFEGKISKDIQNPGKKDKSDRGRNTGTYL